MSEEPQSSADQVQPTERAEAPSFGIFLDGKRADEGTFNSHDHAKQQVRRMQRAMNRKGYSAASERLTIRPLEQGR